MTAGSPVQHVMDADDGPARLEGELGPEARARAKAHLAACAACREALAEWREVQACLVAYAPPVLPGADRAFWRRLAPRLPERSALPADPAPYLAPAALALGYALFQAVAIVVGLGLMAGAGRALGPAWQQASAAASASWWGSRLAAAGSWLAGAVPAGWSSALGTLAVAVAGWSVLAALAALYAAWIILWLRRPRPAEALGGA